MKEIISDERNDVLPLQYSVRKYRLMLVHMPQFIMKKEDDLKIEKIIKMEDD